MNKKGKDEMQESNAMSTPEVVNGEIVVPDSKNPFYLGNAIRNIQDRKTVIRKIK